MCFTVPRGYCTIVSRDAGEAQVLLVMKNLRERRTRGHGTGTLLHH
jgi:hypothetical protein